MKNPITVTVCPETLAEGFQTYSPNCLEKIANKFMGRTVINFASGHKNNLTGTLKKVKF